MKGDRPTKSIDLSQIAWFGVPLRIAIACAARWSRSIAVNRTRAALRGCVAATSQLALATYASFAIDFAMTSPKSLRSPGGC